MTYSRKDPQLGEKLDVLEGILGVGLPAVYFKRAHQAEWIGTTPQQFTRKCKGKEAVSNRDLSKLIDLYKIGSSFDFRLFDLEIAEIPVVLSKAKIGSYGQPTTMRFREQLIAASNPEKPITICRATSKRAGGIGGESFVSEVQQFRIQDRVYLHIPIPGEGYLILLNDHPAKDEITVLMPSQFATETFVKGNSIRVPTEQDLPYFPVAGPAGFYRLFAVWTHEPILPGLPDFKNQGGAPGDFSTSDLQQLTNIVSLANGDDRPQVMIADYWVT